MGRCTVAFAALAIAALSPAQDRTARDREAMVREHLEARGIRNPDVLRVMRATPRHLFMPPDVRGLAYEDRPVPIGHGATISQPYIVALMTEALEVNKKHRVLEIGAGSGYQAAILAQLVEHVYTIELVPELARFAEGNLKRQGHTNVSVRAGDGYKGWPEAAPFDRVILTAAPPEVPQALIDQLANRGRLIAPVGGGVAQELLLIEKGADGKTRRRSLGDVMFVPMRKGAK
jgi:protein-L-isoaspartate(D-aspartate) O-methyltransferase